MGVKIAEYHLVSTVLQYDVEVGGVVPRARAGKEMYTLTKVNVVPLWCHHLGVCHHQAPYRGRFGG